MTATPLTPAARARRGLFAAADWPRAALVLWLLFVTAVLPWRALTPVDETRYASVAWEMWLRRDLVVLWLNGEPYGHKPPLLFWLVNAGWAVFGVNAWWPLAIPALASAVSLVLLHRIATRLWPDRPAVAQLAPLVLFGAAQWTVFSAALYFDLLLVTFVLLGVFALLDLADGRPWRGSVLFAIAIGFGLLAKGPLVGINLLLLSLLLPWWRVGIARARWGRAWGLIAVSGTAGIAIAGAWLAAATARAGTGYLREIAYAQGLGRVVDSFDHDLPFWWYLPMLAVIAFPWAWWLDGWRALAGLVRRHLDEPGVRLALSWALPAFVMLSLISGKRAHYLMGMLPALALLGARALEPLLERPGMRLGTAPAAVLMLAAAGGLAWVPTWAQRDSAPPWASAFPAWLAAVPLVVAVTWFAVRRLDRRVLALAVGSAAICGMALVAFARFSAPAYDVTPAARRIAEAVARGVPVAVVGDYHGQFQFAGRLREPLPTLERRAVDGWLAEHPDGRVVVNVRRLPDPPPPDVWLYRSGWLMLADAALWARLHGAPASDP